MFGSKKLYLIVVGVIIAGFGVCTYLWIASVGSVNYGATIPTSAAFVGLPTQISDTRVSIHDLPLQMSLSQTMQLKRYISTQSSTLPKDTLVVGTYREDSVSYESGDTTILVDVPAIKQTLSVTIFDDGVSSIGCASESDQEDPSWACIEEGVAE